jgi:hypothetical protein
MSVEKTPSTPQIREDGNTLQELLSDDAGQRWQSRCINGCCDFFPSRSRQHPLLPCKITSQNGTAAEPSKESGSRTPDSISVTSSTGISASQSPRVLPGEQFDAKGRGRRPVTPKSVAVGHARTS